MEGGASVDVLRAVMDRFIVRDLGARHGRGSLSRCVFVKQKTAYEMRISDWSSDVCSSDLQPKTLPRPNRCVNRSRNAFRASTSWRSEERRVGKECVCTCRSRWSPDH